MSFVGAFLAPLSAPRRGAPPEASPPAPGGLPSDHPVVPAAGRATAAACLRGARALVRRAAACRLSMLAAVLSVGLAALAVPMVAQAQTEVPADWNLKPTGLAAGDKFRLLFVSSTKRNATSTAIGDYNTFIQNRAAAGHMDIQSHSSSFRVVGSTADTDARDNTGTTYTSADKGVPIYWLGINTKVADDYEDFYDGSWDEQIDVSNESGTALTLTLRLTIIFLRAASMTEPRLLILAYCQQRWAPARRELDARPAVGVAMALSAATLGQAIRTHGISMVFSPVFQVAAGTTQSSDATLSALSLSDGTLAPAFDPATTTGYTALVSIRSLR